MKLTLLRFYDSGKATAGLLFVDGKFECYTLEDEHRDVKVMAETRIPEGTFEIKYRKEGGHHTEYSKKFGKEHFGMLHLQNVPKFEYILIHIGNSEKDSAGCILVGNQITRIPTLVDSTGAYKSLYAKVATALNKGEKVTIEIKKCH
jgi:hypothetical protein